MSKLIAFLIFAPEGSGTYMLAEAFASSGCVYCNQDDVAAFLKDKQPELLVVRRSLPHAGKWPNIEEVAECMYRYGYHVLYVYIFRNQEYTIKSVVRRTEIPYEKARATYLEAKGRCEQIAESHNASRVSYELMCADSKYRTTIFDVFGLRPPTIEFRNENLKYYEQSN